jgi:hypothetical protein
MLHVPYSNVVRSCTRPDISQAASVISPCNLQGLLAGSEMDSLLFTKRYSLWFILRQMQLYHFQCHLVC